MRTEDFNAASLTTAWGDESVRMVGEPPFYMLGVCLLGGLDDPGIERLASLKPAGSRKLHWRDMGRVLQRESLCILNSIERADIVVIASPLNGRRQERARRKCLEALLPELERRGIERVVLESRKQSSDRHDLDYVDYAKGARLVSSIRVEHEDGAFEPRLWIVDQMLGAMGDQLTRRGNWKYWNDEWEHVRAKIERIDVSL